MLTMSFGCLAFLRGLFPDDSFIDQRFVPEKVEKNYDKNNSSQGSSIKVKTLVRGKSSEVDILLDWLEKGVFKSIKMKYLKALSMGIFLDEKYPNDLIENYVFSFSYDEDENVSLSINNGAETTCSRSVAFNQIKPDTISLLDSRKMAQQLMRRFIIITQSLEPLPEKKFLTMRLMFNERTDPEYQPMFFRDATYEKQATIKIPASLDRDAIEVGTLDTKIHKLTMNVLSALELKENEDYIEIDPFNVVNESNLIIEDSVNKEESQTTNILGNILKSSQFSLQPTQAVYQISQKALPTCECKEDISTSSTALKCCKRCNKIVHGLCYGNYHSQKIDSCIECLCGQGFDYSADCFKDLMMVRRCYRYLARLKGSLPRSLRIIYTNIITRNTEDDPEVVERFQFCISALFFGSILSIDEQKIEISRHSQHKASPSMVMNDFEKIFITSQKKLQPGSSFGLRFHYSSPNALNCYVIPLAKSRDQIMEWLEEIRNLKAQYRTFLTESYDIGKLTLNDNQESCTFEESKKRKLPGYEDSVPIDTQELFQNLKCTEKPKKYRKISISKKTLKSVW